MEAVHRQSPGLLALWFGLRAPVSRRTYVLTGFGLMFLKYGVDAAVFFLHTGGLWTPLDYLSPLATSKQELLGSTAHFVVAAIWTLPFVWIGASMTIRRAADAGLSSWLGLLFFVPIVNYLAMLFLSTCPTRTPARGAGWGEGSVRPVVDQRLRSALLSVAAGLSIGVGMTLFSVFVSEEYGA